MVLRPGAVGRGDDVAEQPRAGRSALSHRLALATVRPVLGPLALVALFVFFGALYPDTFLSRTNLVENVLGQVAVVAVVAVAQTVVMVVGEFDLSVSGTAALAMVACGSVLTTVGPAGPREPGSVVWALALGLLAGLLAGLLNGLVVAYVGVLAFIATLGTATVFTNLARFRVGGQPLYSLAEPGFVDVARSRPFGVPATVFVAGGIALAVWILLDHTTLGRRMYAVGGNPEAARMSGLAVKRVKLLAFVVCAVAAAAAGLLQSAYNATADTSSPDPWMLRSIAAVFLGMAMFRAGRPNLPGTILGILLFRVLDNGLTFTSLDSYLQSVISGAAIILAVLPPAVARLRGR